MVLNKEQKETIDEMRPNEWYYFQAEKFLKFFDELEKLGIVEKKKVTGKKMDGTISTMFGYKKTIRQQSLSGCTQ